MSNTIQGPDTSTQYNIHLYPDLNSGNDVSLRLESTTYTDEDVVGLVQALQAIEGITVDQVSKNINVSTSEFLDLESDPLEFTI